MKKKIAIYGSTGSIGRQALEVVAQYPDDLEASVLVANNSHHLLIEQAIAMQPDIVVIHERHYAAVKDALACHPIKVFAGSAAMEEVASMNVYDIMLSSIVGFSGMRTTLRALEHGKAVALANKESMVVAGNLMRAAAQTNKAKIIPVDSELVAIDQCLDSGVPHEIAKVILTASGGAFINKSKDFIAKATFEQALLHPTWSMGNKITIDSASLMNKGLEMIEAQWLFNLPADKITALIHPQSIIHSMVEFIDGQVMAQLGMPDMRVPIAYAFFYPIRREALWSKLDLLKVQQLSFQAIDENTFPAIALAKEAMQRGGNIPCVLNASNEVVVQAYMEGKISFYQMTDIVAKALAQAAYIAEPSLEDYLACDSTTRAMTMEWAGLYT